MAVSQANSRVVARVFNGLIVQDQILHGPASYDSSGQRFVFCPGPQTTGKVVIDVEFCCESLPHVLAQTLSSEDLSRWTEIEVLAKLFGLPVFQVVKEFKAVGWRGLASSYPAKIIRCDSKTHFITAGMLVL